MLSLCNNLSRSATEKVMPPNLGYERKTGQRENFTGATVLMDHFAVKSVAKKGNKHNCENKDYLPFFRLKMGIQRLCSPRGNKQSLPPKEDYPPFFHLCGIQVGKAIDLISKELIIACSKLKKSPLMTWPTCERLQCRVLRKRRTTCK